MSKGVKKKKRVGRPRTGKRPVIAIRVHNDLYEEIRKSSVARDLSISEEVENRIKQSFEWDRTHGDIRKMRPTVGLTGTNLEAALSQAGYQRIHLDQGIVWAQPGMDVRRMSVSVDAAAVVQAMEPDLTAALVRALEKARDGRS